MIEWGVGVHQQQSASEAGVSMMTPVTQDLVVHSKSSGSRVGPLQRETQGNGVATADVAGWVGQQEPVVREGIDVPGGEKNYGRGGQKRARHRSESGGLMTMHCKKRKKKQHNGGIAIA